MSERKARDRSTVVVASPNWLGDCIMAMPAVQSFRLRHPDARMVLLVKPRVHDLWAMHEAPDEIVPLRSGLRGAGSAVRRLRRLRADRGYVLTPSIRPALIARLGGVPERIGAPGHPGRRWLLTRTVPESRTHDRHQAYGHMAVLGASDSELAAPPEAPRLAIPESRIEEARVLLDGTRAAAVAFFPGAAYGPSKIWPTERFIALGRRLVEEREVRVVVLGAAGEHALCRHVTEGIGGGAIDLSGRTPLPVLAAVLRLCEGVVSNDSGGMHLAAALGTPVVAIFGLTDPSRTGPIGGPGRVLQAPGVRPSSIGPVDERAREALDAIEVDAVHEALLGLIDLPAAPGSGLAAGRGAARSNDTTDLHGRAERPGEGRGGFE